MEKSRQNFEGVRHPLMDIAIRRDSVFTQSVALGRRILDSRFFVDRYAISRNGITCDKKVVWRFLAFATGLHAPNRGYVK
mgnify:CR=1 FL=1